MGVENLLWGSDFPHQESEYPHSDKVLDENFSGVTDEERRKMVCENAIAFFHLQGEPFERSRSAR
jgi:predicted TIM-barrel fold metal-dependent hydrolase